MLNQKNLTKIINKEIITMSELQQIINSEFVIEVKRMASDDKYKNLAKFDIRLENGETHFIYVK